SSLKDGQAHSLSLRIKGTSVILDNSPRTITCASATLYTGLFESADCNTVKGYAWDKNYPDKVLTVELLDGNTVVGTTNANAYREDLFAAGMGTGKYGFSLPLPASLKDGQSHTLSIRIKGTGVLLASSPRKLTCAALPAYAGSFESVGCDSIRGFAWDKSYPAKALTVELLENDVVIGSTSASLYRDDLKASGMGTGNYGFRIALPSSLKDGQPHSLSVRIKGTSVILDNSPRTITCNRSSARVASIEEADAENEEERFGDITVIVAPNPTRGIVSVSFDMVASSNEVRMSILNMSGQIIWNKIVTGQKRIEQSIDLSDSQQGMYMLRVESGVQKINKRVLLIK
ncbi:T9SS type A sorting domain-containing protein, partial [Dyadobacter sp.]|uniref:T9SS type A sorting domain-containing protein n=1 Tax=Dyadobacter sp. TaxID=1914288 RepID=UPI003F7181CD